MGSEHLQKFKNITSLCSLSLCDEIIKNQSQQQIRKPFLQQPEIQSPPLEDLGGKVQNE